MSRAATARRGAHRTGVLFALLVIGCVVFSALAAYRPTHVEGAAPTVPGSASEVGANAPTLPASPSVPIATVAPAANASLARWHAVSASVSPPTRADASMAYDPSLNATLLFGGFFTGGSCLPFTDCPMNDTWEYVGGLWFNLTPTHLTPSNNPVARWGAALVFDPSVGGVVLFGGTTSTPTGLNNPGLNDTWEYVGGHWSEVCASGCSSPAPRWDASAAFDNSTSELVVFAGQTTVGGTVSNLNDTWTFDPSSDWTQISLVSAPTPRAGAAVAWDGELNGLVLFGGIPLNSETWLLRNLTWFSLATSVAPGGVPSQRGGASLSPDPLNDSVVLFGGCTSLPCGNSVDDDTWVLANFGWHNLTSTANLGGGPPPRGETSLVPAGPRGALLLFGGWSGAPASPANDSWTLVHLEVANFTATPTVTDVGLPVAMSVNVSGGFGPPRLVWHGLPPGCVTANVTRLTCRATGAGPYSPSVWVTATDPAGEVVNTSVVNFKLNALPSLSLLATPLTGIVLDQVSFAAQPSGGTRVDPQTVRWEFGDGGSGVGPNPTHGYLRPGTFHVEANVTDAVGVLATTNLTVTALARLVASASFSPEALTLGGATDLNVSVRSGTGPFTIVPVGSLPGCTVGFSTLSNVTVYHCSPTAVGSIKVSFRVNDSSGQVVTASANLTVSAMPPRVAPPAAAFPWLLLGAGLLAAIVAGIVTYWILRSRRRRDGPMVPPPRPERPIPPANLYVPPEDAHR